ncbi:MAG: hypothetical protein ACI835_000181 [Planctomycetota bacterium]|jgi:hypothetical protein
MENNSDLICFQCGQGIIDPPKINELPGGGNCPCCVNRVLSLLPAALPSDQKQEVEVDEAHESVEVAESVDVEQAAAYGEGERMDLRAYEPPPEPA